MSNTQEEFNSKECNAISAMFSAAKNGEVEAFDEVLIEIKNLPNVEFMQAINYQNNKGPTAIMFAARDGHINIVDRFIELGADLTLKTYAGECVFDYASTTEIYSKLIDALGGREAVKAKNALCPK